MDRMNCGHGMGKSEPSNFTLADIPVPVGQGDGSAMPGSSDSLMGMMSNQVSDPAMMLAELMGQRVVPRLGEFKSLRELLPVAQQMGMGGERNHENQPLYPPIEPASQTPPMGSAMGMMTQPPMPAMGPAPPMGGMGSGQLANPLMALMMGPMARPPMGNM